MVTANDVVVKSNERKPISDTELMAMELPPPKWAVRELLPEGVTILAGKPGTKKSWLALGLGVEVAAGGTALGAFPVEQAGEVYYLGLENNDIDLQERLKLVLGGRPTTGRLFFDWTFPRGDGKEIKELDRWLSDHPNARLVVIDTWAHFRTPSRGNKNAYDGGLEEIKPLCELAKRHHVAILLIHHERKMPSADDIDAFSGGLSIVGSADVGMLLRDATGNRPAKLSIVKSRAMPTKTIPLRFDDETLRWTALDDNARNVMAPLSEQRVAVTDALRARGPLTPALLAKLLGITPDAGRQRLFQMKRDGQVVLVGAGEYGLPENANNALTPLTANERF